jgi:AcrR family transcriptional regulator
VPSPGRRQVAAQTYDRILDAAAHVLAEVGYAATTNQIAAAAEVSIGSLYQYFADKDAVVVALHHRHLDRVQAQLSGAASTDPDAWAGWLVTQLSEASRSPEARVLWELSRTVPLMRARISALVDELSRSASRTLGISQTWGRTVVVCALAVVHEVVFPKDSPWLRRHAQETVATLIRHASG